LNGGPTIVALNDFTSQFNRKDLDQLDREQSSSATRQCTAIIFSSPQNFDCLSKNVSSKIEQHQHQQRQQQTNNCYRCRSKTREKSFNGQKKLFVTVSLFWPKKLVSNFFKNAKIFFF